MMRQIRERSMLAQALCLLCVGLVVAMGTAQAAHAHPAASLTDHHSCSICSAPSIGPAVAALQLLPLGKPVVMVYSAREIFVTYRPVLTNFVRPPPAF